MTGVPAHVTDVSVDYCIALTAPVTRGDLGKACGGQVRCWPGVIFFLAHLLERDHLYRDSPVVSGIPPCLIVYVL